MIVRFINNSHRDGYIHSYPIRNNDSIITYLVKHLKIVELVFE